MMRHRVKRITRLLVAPSIVGLIGLVIAGGCSTSECYDNQNSLPLAGFYTSAARPQAISLDSISILGIGAPGDSILQDSVRTISQVYLPFRLDQNSTTYEIQYLSALPGIYYISDYITFNYDILPMFVSAACGAVYYYKITSIETTHNFIDSVTCPSGEITNANIENLKIYFRVNTGEGEDEL
ncbi:MAG: hypothetical protein J1F16_07080 [Muribaculaceae bacterium]|nr:hypothetical protein [Muribaculaceae bacterium]